MQMHANESPGLFLFFSTPPHPPRHLNDMNHLQFCQHPVKLPACLSASLNRTASPKDQEGKRKEKEPFPNAIRHFSL